MRKNYILFTIALLVLIFALSLLSYGEDAKTYYKLGYTYFSQKNYKEAIASYKKALELDPKNADAFYWIGKCYFELKQYSKAMDAWFSALRIKESHKGAFLKLVNYYYYLIPKSFGDPEGYLNYAKKILKVNEENFISEGLPTNTLLIGFASLKRYLRDYPSSITANFIIGQVYEKLSYNFSYQFYGYAISSYKKVIDYEEKKHGNSFFHPLEYWFSYKRLIKIYEVIDRKDLAEKFREKMQSAVESPYNAIFRANNLEPLGMPDRVEVIYKDGKREEIWYYNDKGISFVYKDGTLRKREEGP